ncbi:MAG: hypothetical protein EP329_13680 [Deltaproteobacteria bacterium]|nr:MAG: hypothetical protein EP329_13680 [Deltaproteobacteria bacterium]
MRRTASAALNLALLLAACSSSAPPRDDADTAAADAVHDAVASDTAAVDDDTAAVDDDTTAVDDDTAAVDDDTTAVDDDTAAVDDGTATDTGPLPGALTVTTTLSAETVAAGGLVEVACDVHDDDGAAWDLPTFIDTELATTGDILQPTLAGEHAVTCRLVDGDAEAAHVAASLQVVAGPIHAVVARIDPERPYFAPGDAVEVLWSTVDAYANVTAQDDTAVTITALPAAAVEALSDGAFTLLTDGVVSFTVATTTDPPLTDTVLVVVDGVPPALTLTAPAPGTHVDGDGLVTISGHVADALGAVSLTVAGAAVEVASDGTFSTVRSSTQGLNVATAVATDEAGNTATTSTSWLYSPAWTAIGAAPAADGAPDALSAHLGAGGIDGGVVDGFPDDLSKVFFGAPTAPITLASWSYPQTGLAFEELYTDGCSACPCRVSKIDVTRLDVALELSRISAVRPSSGVGAVTARDGGFDVAWAGDVTFDLALRVTSTYDRLEGATETTAFDVNCYPATSGPSGLSADTVIRFTASGTVSVDGSIALSKAPGAAVAHSSSFDIDLTGALPDVTAGLATPIELGTLVWGTSWGTTQREVTETLAAIDPSLPTDVAAGVAATDLLAPATATLRAHLTARAAALETLFASLETGWTATPPDAAAPVVVETWLDRLAVSPAGVDLALTGRVGTTAAETNADTLGLGAIQRAGCLADPPDVADLSGIATFGAGYHVDLLSQLLYAGWVAAPRPLTLEGAALTPVAALVPEGVTLLDVRLTQHAAPIVTDCAAAGAEVQVGGAEVVSRFEIDGDEVSVRTWVAVTAALALTTPPTTITLGEPTWRRLETEATAPSALAAAAGDVAREVVRRELLERIIPSTLELLPATSLDLNALESGGADLGVAGAAEPTAGLLLNADCSGCERCPMYFDTDDPLAGWTFTGTCTTVGWHLDTFRARSLPASLYYGDPAVRSTACPYPNRGTATSPPITLPADRPATVRFDRYLDVDYWSGADVLSLWVMPANVKIWSKPTGPGGTPTPPGFETVTRSLAAYAGQTIQLQLRYDAGGQIYYVGEGIYIDDLVVDGACP